MNAFLFPYLLEKVSLFKGMQNKLIFGVSDKFRECSYTSVSSKSFKFSCLNVIIFKNNSLTFDNKNFSGYCLKSLVMKNNENSCCVPWGNIVYLDRRNSKKAFVARRKLFLSKFT